VRGKAHLMMIHFVAAIVILFPSILTESYISSTTLCWIKRLSYMSSGGLALAGTVPCCVVGCCYLWMIVPSLVNALACCVLSCCRCLTEFSLVVAVSTFGHRTVRRYNNTHCNYGVNPQHEGSISELHCAKSFFLARARTVHFFWQRIILVDQA
jgi:hypothetical protein